MTTFEKPVLYMTKDPHNPVRVRLGDIKPTLQQEAHEADRSLHYIIVKILKDYVKKKKAN